jgi:hypothetical protein
MLLKDAVEVEKKIDNIHTRKKMLEGQLNSLELNQMNFSSIELVEMAQKVYKETMIDPSKL